MSIEPSTVVIIALLAYIVGMTVGIIINRPNNK